MGSKHGIYIVFCGEGRGRGEGRFESAGWYGETMNVYNKLMLEFHSGHK